MNTHIDTLNEWYENAEQITRENMPRDGDTIMYPRAGGAYTIEPATYGWVESIVHPDDDVRILHRAPQPEPAWHNAVAVIAHKDGDYGVTPREVYVRTTGDRWESQCYYARTAELIAPTPLIEAKVTDEMCDRVRDYYRTEHHAELPRDAVWLNDLLAAALGLDPA